MTPIEILHTVNEYQTTDSISRKNSLFNLIRENAWKIWFIEYQNARKLYLEIPIPTVENLLIHWGPIEKDLTKYENGHSYYTRIDVDIPPYHHSKLKDKIVLSGLTEEGINIGLPTSIVVPFRKFNPDYLDLCLREMKPYLHNKLRGEIYGKEQELKKLQEAYEHTENPILSKLRDAEPGTALWYERWYEGQIREAKEVKLVCIKNREIIVEINGIKVSFDSNGTATSENDYTSACMLFPSSDHKRWDDVTYVPATRQSIVYK